MHTPSLLMKHYEKQSVTTIVQYQQVYWQTSLSLLVYLLIIIIISGVGTTGAPGAGAPTLTDS